VTAGTLYLVGTPIGNLDDVTARALTTLGSVALIAAEDTRRTGLLLSRLGIPHGRLVSLFEGNEAARVPEVVAALQEGTNVALVSDAGMPGVSDPGYRLPPGATPPAAAWINTRSPFLILARWFSA